MGGTFIKTILATFLTILMLLPISAFGEILTIKQTVKQTYGGGQSSDDARISAIAKAKREALEKAGTYIESLTVVKNSKVEKDEILALTAGVLKAEVVSQKNYHTKKSLGIEFVVEVIVDTSFLEARVKKLLEDRAHLEDLNQARKKEKELLAEIAKLEAENILLIAQNKSSIELNKQFQEASQALKAVDLLNKALALVDINNGKSNNPHRAIEYLNEAIHLKPDFAVAYNARGCAYTDLSQHQRAIEDFNETIRLWPNYAGAYHNRGTVYAKLGQHQQAIEDFNEALSLWPVFAEARIGLGNSYNALGQHQRAIKELNEVIRLWPDFAKAYNNRGLIYGNLNQHQRAIDDFNETIRLNPDYAVEAYYSRGIAYAKLGQHQRAIEDFTKAIHLKPDYAEAYYNRGFTYLTQDQHQRAIDDFNQVIRLWPNYAMAYSNRGLAYLLKGNKEQGCLDAQKACELGSCKILEFNKGNGYCR